ncbi:MAG TPA: serine--tRNA ligase [Anaerolineales bacterium]|nr:serine--tRNA ligase [Anaerolineales bacterium]
MLDINLVRNQPDIVRASMKARRLDAPIDRALELDGQRRSLLTEVEKLKAERNAASKAISQIKDPAEKQAKIAEQKGLGDKIAALDDQVRQVEAELDTLLSGIPNVLDARVPDGDGDSQNVVIKTVGEPKPLPFEPKPHWDLGTALGIINFEQGVKLTGSRFYVLHGAGARLQRALIAFMLDLHTRKQDYNEAYTPFMVKEETMFGAGQLPKFKDNLYRDAEEDLWMVPTAEVPLTCLHRDEIMDAASLPKRYSAYTPCFRREKMAAGRDVRGIKRGHQFDKVEMYSFTLPEESDKELEQMREDAEQTCAELGLVYRVKQLCSGDVGFSARMTYDIEVWAPGQNEWLEVSSVSNCGDFQARRANVRFRREAGAKPEFAHTLNGSGLGLPRTMIAVMENYQQADGSIVVPEVLRLWMGGIDVIR